MPRRDFTTAEVVGMIKAWGPARCESSYERGCRCPQHRGPAAAPALAVVAPIVVCTGTLVCECPTCSAERAARVRSGPKSGIRQPWDAMQVAA